MAAAFIFDAELIVKAPMGVVPPTALLRVIDPVPAVKVRFCAPFTVPERMMSPGPPPPELKLTGPFKVIALPREIEALDVWMVPFKETAPPPLWVNGPLGRIEAP